MLPFTREQFLSVFASYNMAIWPAQVIAYVIGLAAVAALYRPSAASDRLIGATLATMWIWTGVAYHWLFFSQINKAAYAFGALFVFQGVLLIFAGVLRRKLRFEPSAGHSTMLGLAFLAYAGLLYPLIGRLTGHAYPSAPNFGVTPCPVTIFTFGLFLLSRGRLPWWLLVIPIIWSLIGGSAAILLDVPQDWFLLVSGLIAATVLVLARERHPRPGNVGIR